MNATEIINAMPEVHKVNFSSLYTAKHGEHIDTILALGRAWPANRNQAKKIGRLDHIYNSDVAKVEALLNKHGMAGDYELSR